MQIAWKAVLALLAANLLPAQINPKVWNLIEPGDKLVFGLNLDRYRQSNLGAAGNGDGALPFGIAQYLVKIAGDPKKGGPVTIMLGFAPPPEWREHNPLPTMLDATTAIEGDAERVRDSIQRWNHDAPLADIAADARALGESDDAWFVIAKPLASGDRDATAAAPKYLAEVVEVVEQASGGMRFGEYAQAHLNVRAKTAEDAYSLAALGRWLPGLIQAMQPGGKESRAIDLLENLSVQAMGRTVSLSCSVPQAKLAALMREARSDIGQ